MSWTLFIQIILLMFASVICIMVVLLTLAELAKSQTRDSAPDRTRATLSRDR